ncbi:hypothetical protein JCM4814A_51020 [Streptomyces phaeofaciens JCM 4814]|uniref:Peptidase inhibitor family I36 n=1 Tax=Streptomyces phaeofaciens TaxID=68254 RepID=A0A918HNL3_9ACTN|nr:hypothetical protein [Streptomyces phaeofaciens]GGT88099.1 hypothetical protein GCM10010226_78160 [Streptomyces phaeofaciens]
MRRLLRGAAALALTTVAVLTGTTQAQAKADDGSWAGCPYGAVCIYPQNQNPAVSPSHIFYSYGFHPIYNQYGNHWVLNNQYDGALAETCDSVDTDCHFTIGPQEGFYVDLTPINSILLREHYQ